MPHKGKDMGRPMLSDDLDKEFAEAGDMVGDTAAESDEQIDDSLMDVREGGMMADDGMMLEDPVEVDDRKLDDRYLDGDPII
jgi:hypothetical protein